MNLAFTKLVAVVWILACLNGGRCVLGEQTVNQQANHPGYRHLVETAYLPPDFDQETFDAVWRQWPTDLRVKAEHASAGERRQLAFERYGLTGRPDDSTKPLQYVVDSAGNWTMNCFACHGGSVLGETIPGLPNANYALELLTSEIRATKLQLGKPLSRMDMGALVMPLGTTRGTSNAVMFGVALMANRDSELNVLTRQGPPAMVHHDMDAPPWWHFRYRQAIYIDGFAPKNHRGLMQFMLVPQNGPAQFAAWEEDFRDVYDYLMSLEAPKFPFPVDADLAAQGQALFQHHCADCHGTYGKARHYPGRCVPLEELGTDPVRWQALTPAHRQSYANSWFHRLDKQAVVTAPTGYVAPPLDGVWASAPYFHNGSVPTLWHVLHPQNRPEVWQRDGSYQTAEVGLGWMTATGRGRSPSSAVFDTRLRGKSGAGHDYPDALREPEKRAVLEYLKTL